MDYRARKARRPHVRITERDQALLAFIAEHRVVLASHAQALLRTSGGAAHARLGALSRAGMLKHEAPFERQPRCYWITRKGLDAIESDLAPPRLDLRSYKHDIGLAWLWLAARRGAFGPLHEIVSERRMRSSDAARAHSGPRAPADPSRTWGIGAKSEPFAVRLGGLGPGGRERLHYPDLLLIGREGRRVAVELELSTKSRARRQRILGGYAADPRIDAAVYLVEHGGVSRAIETMATRLGVSDRVHVRRIAWGEQRSARAPGRGSERIHSGDPAIRGTSEARRLSAGAER